MIEELAARVFQARDVAHRAHWRTNSYAQHIALGEFYDAVVDEIDAIVETYQGQFGLVADFRLFMAPVPDVAAYLQTEANWIAANRDKIARNSAELQNLIDGLVALYRRTLYKLTQLA